MHRHDQHDWFEDSVRGEARTRLVKLSARVKGTLMVNLESQATIAGIEKNRKSDRKTGR